MRKEEFSYDLPQERIALYPAQPRDKCRLLVIHKQTGEIEHRLFSDITDYLTPGDCLVLNQSKVEPVRIRLKRRTGGVVELLFTKELSKDTWVALAKPAKRLKPGEVLFGDRGEEMAEITDKDKGRLRLKLFLASEELFRLLGLAPLPGYIQRLPEDKDLDTYQTVFARTGFSIAAPTAGLHFTKGLLNRVKEKGAEIAFIQLDVGEATFRPIRTEKVEEHSMPAEHYVISAQAADKINASKRIIAVGTTVTRTLESLPSDVPIEPGEDSTDLFIYPGYEFKRISALLTNFHQPGSTPLLLTSAFCGKELLFTAYHTALDMDYRFLSYGDAMLIIPHETASPLRVQARFRRDPQ